LDRWGVVVLISATTRSPLPVNASMSKPDAPIGLVAASNATISRRETKYSFAINVATKLMALLALPMISLIAKRYSNHS
jgi:hypothetical protein